MLQNNKRATEQFLVASVGQTALATNASTFVSAASGFAINNGQIGILGQATGSGYGEFNTFFTAPTLATAPAIKLVQGTQYSGLNYATAVPSPLWARPFEETRIISGKNNLITVRRITPVDAAHAVRVFGDIETNTTTFIPVTSNTDYNFSLSYKGRRADLFYSHDATARLNVRMNAANFTSTGLNLTNILARDYITTSIVNQINAQSSGLTGNAAFRKKEPIVAFQLGVALSGPAGVAAGVAISGLVAGNTLTVSTINGINRTITLTAEQAASLVAIGTGTSFTHILTATDVSAGTATSGTGTGFAVMALDETLSFLDYMPSVKIDFEAALTGGFNTTTQNKKVSFAVEGRGEGRRLNLLYQATQGQRKYQGRHTVDPVIEFPSPIVDGTDYTVFTINHGSTREINTGGMSYSPYLEYILIPESNTTLSTALTSALNTYLAFTGNPNVDVV